VKFFFATKGDFLLGKYNGYGVYTTKEKEVYKGQFRDNVREGKGFIAHSNGDTYDGEWKKNLKTGFGKYYYKSIDAQYEGEFVESKKNGKGFFVYKKTGDSYEGGFKDDKTSGKGILRFGGIVGGAYKNGDWLNGLLNGFYFFKLIFLFIVYLINSITI
jgi:hypothetical protein